MAGDKHRYRLGSCQEQSHVFLRECDTYVQAVNSAHLSYIGKNELLEELVSTKALK